MEVGEIDLYTITSRIKIDRKYMGYTIIDMNGNAYSVSNKFTLELALHSLLSNATYYRYEDNETKLVGKTDLRKLTVTILKEAIEFDDAKICIDAVKINTFDGYTRLMEIAYKMDAMSALNNIICDNIDMKCKGLDVVWHNQVRYLYSVYKEYIKVFERANSLFSEHGMDKVCVEYITSDNMKVTYIRNNKPHYYISLYISAKHNDNGIVIFTNIQVDCNGEYKLPQDKNYKDYKNVTVECEKVKAKLMKDCNTDSSYDIK